MITPLKLGIIIKPPSLLISYEVVKSFSRPMRAQEDKNEPIKKRRKRRRSIPLRNFSADSDLNKYYSSLCIRHSDLLSRIPQETVEKMLRIIQQVSRGEKLSDAIERVEEEYREAERQEGASIKELRGIFAFPTFTPTPNDTNIFKNDSKREEQVKSPEFTALNIEEDNFEFHFKEVHQNSFESGEKFDFGFGDGSLFSKSFKDENSETETEYFKEIEEQIAKKCEMIELSDRGKKYEIFESEIEGGGEGDAVEPCKNLDDKIIISNLEDMGEINVLINKDDEVSTNRDAINKEPEDGVRKINELEFKSFEEGMDDRKAVINENEEEKLKLSKRNEFIDYFNKKDEDETFDMFENVKESYDEVIEIESDKKEEKSVESSDAVKIHENPKALKMKDEVQIEFFDCLNESKNENNSSLEQGTKNELIEIETNEKDQELKNHAIEPINGINEPEEYECEYEIESDFESEEVEDIDDMSEEDEKIQKSNQLTKEYDFKVGMDENESQDEDQVVQMTNDKSKSIFTKINQLETINLVNESQKPPKESELVESDIVASGPPGPDGTETDDFWNI